MVRLLPTQELAHTRIARLSRRLREAAELELVDIETSFGIVTDCIEPRARLSDIASLGV